MRTGAKLCVHLILWMMVIGQIPAAFGSGLRGNVGLSPMSAPQQPASAPLHLPPNMSSSPSNTLYFNNTQVLVCGGEAPLGFLTNVLLSNWPYIFGCLSYQCVPHSVYLTVALVRGSSIDVPIWVANRGHPTSCNSTIRLPAGDGAAGVQLHDSDGTVVWVASNTSAAAGIRLHSSGNLVIFDKQGSSLWESFDDPADVLVPGQSLKPGESLLAGFSSDSPNNGNFTAIMYPGGIVFYELSSTTPVPYFAAIYPFQRATLKDVFSNPCNKSVLMVTSYELSVVQENASNPSCSNLTPINPTFSSPVAFVRLDSDGNIRGYHFDSEVPFDVFANSSHHLCDLPNYCGPYGICEHEFNRKSTCTCPNFASSNFTPGFGTPSCTPAIPLDCQQGAAYQEFLDLVGIDYFANDLIEPTMVTGSLTDCKAACARNCSCKAAYYRPHLGHCFHHDIVLSMVVVSQKDYVASLKLQKPITRPPKGVINFKMKLFLGIGLSVLMAGSCFIVSYRFVARRDSRFQRIKTNHEDMKLLSGWFGQPKRFSFEELQAATNGFGKRLGVGGFGSVYLGALSDGSQVAVKQLEITRNEPQGLEEFRAEVVALSSINHQNLVHLRGFCADGSHRLLVYEYMPNGSLDKWLFAPKSLGYERLDWNTRLSIAVQTARGLYFLHEQCRKAIVHLDVKPQNILLDENFVAKLSDFGLARLINEENLSSSSRMRGTPGYVAPECVRPTDATDKSDVYSFGMVLLEIVGGRRNVDVGRLAVHGDREGWYFPALARKKYMDGNVGELVDGALGRPSDETMAEIERVMKVAFWCIQDDPTLRPSMGDVLLLLQGYRTVESPPLSFHCGMRKRQHVDED